MVPTMYIHVIVLSLVEWIHDCMLHILHISCGLCIEILGHHILHDMLILVLDVHSWIAPQLHTVCYHFHIFGLH